MVNRKDFRPSSRGSTGISEKDRETIRRKHSKESLEGLHNTGAMSDKEYEKTKASHPELYSQSKHQIIYTRPNPTHNERTPTQENTDSEAVREVSLTMDNEEAVYRHEQEIYKNYDRKKKNGTYDEALAEQGFYNLSAVPFARKYEKEWHVHLTNEDRHKLAHERLLKYKEYREENFKD